MSRLTRAEAESLLKPHYERFHSCVRPAWDDYISKYPPEVRMIHTPRTKANILRDHMVERARQAFENVPNVRLLTQRGYFLVHVEGKALLRFKKLGKNRRSRNYPTKQAIAFMDNLPLDGIPESTRLDVGYQLNDPQTTIAAVLISCARWQGTEYVINLEVELQSSIPQVHEITPSQHAETQVHPKVGELKKMKNEASS